MIKIYKYGEVSNSEIFARDNIAGGVEGIVSQIIENVIENGDAALLEYAKNSIRLSSQPLKLPKRKLPRR